MRIGVMEVKDFFINEAVESRGAKLVMPEFNFKDRRQLLEGLETERFRIVSNERIHIELGINKLREKFTILRGLIKVEHVCSDLSNYTFIDRLVVVTCCFNEFNAFDYDSIVTSCSNEKSGNLNTCVGNQWYILNNIRFLNFKVKKKKRRILHNLQYSSTCIYKDKIKEVHFSRLR